MSDLDPSVYRDQEIILGLIASLHLNSDYSDLTIICKDAVFSAHKLLVCSRSEYFRRACSSGFKETYNPIHLDEQDPILIEKMLEFLYTGNYTFRSRTPKSPETVDGEAHADEPMIESPLPTELAMNESAPNDETLSEQRDTVELVADTLAECHPCYFHVRMYGVADYFMIGDLKSKAEGHFRASFMDCLERDSFAEMIQELYSTQANYQKLRQLAIQMIVANLPRLRTGRTPVIDAELMKSVPDFTYDLCQATLDNYVPHIREEYYY
ncbi:hypothetical protein CBS147326_6534 [Penicillium roqueforti]|nr:hypothetical protein LCP963914a_3106 [Penicillium roqueforti]KAI2721336.1 hypothetical protein CBS147318_1951 [Penicillium roqueforti]KAI3129295.1 hypothetical protein CBS147326_6534 [Penicillium roqueforti]KAI3169648.1 hypothetical protein DTO039G3_5222 [Penicillium roqueforti]KAI3225639.1 hypothetical protein DTO012A9_9498 [Penicillium roqueforti]